jgi:predicted metalloprotease
MKWDQQGDHSRNVEDRRGDAPSAGGLRAHGGKLSIGGILLIVVVAVGRNFLGGGNAGSATTAGVNAARDAIGSASGGGGGSGQAGAPPSPANDPDLEAKKFSSAILDDVQDFWVADFKKHGKPYEEAKMVLFSAAVDTACGHAGAEVGPFYCPGDERVYLDLSFFRELHDRFGAPGDFAQAYVIAHEMGHHVQRLLGASDQVERASRRDPSVANEMSVKLELQADCYAGVWAHSSDARKNLEAGDIEEGLGAAAAVGDDRLQKQATGRVNPETWTHGSSQQRQTWFTKGYQSGDLAACDTFSAR